jgi:hypothetical protein
MGGSNAQAPPTKSAYYKIVVHQKHKLLTV